MVERGRLRDRSGDYTRINIINYIYYAIFGRRYLFNSIKDGRTRATPPVKVDFQIEDSRLVYRFFNRLFASNLRFII